MVAIFLSSLIIMKRQTINQFLGGVVKTFFTGMRHPIASVKNFSAIIWQNSKQIALNTKQKIANAFATTKNMIATKAQAVANTFVSFSFKKLGSSIW